MAQTDRPAPRLPEPPENIDKRYMEDLVRTLQSFIAEERSTSAMRGTTLTLTSLPQTKQCNTFTGGIGKESIRVYLRQLHCVQLYHL